MSYGIIFLFLIGMAIYDIKYRKIRNKMVFPFLIGGVIDCYFDMGISECFIRGFVSLAIFLIFIVPYKMKIIGAGDIKLYMALSLWLPIEETAMVIIAGLVIYMAYSAYILIRKYASAPEAWINSIRDHGLLLRHLMVYRDIDNLDVLSHDNTTKIPFACVIFVGYAVSLLIIKM